jgi:N-acetylneuraminic acid mutarotase
MPRPAHHAALAAANGKIYVMGGFVPPKDTAIPIGGAWEPIDNAWEYDPAADSWKSLPPLPGKRGSALAAEVGGKIYVIGGAGLRRSSHHLPRRSARAAGLLLQLIDTACAGVDSGQVGEAGRQFYELACWL